MNFRLPFFAVILSASVLIVLALVSYKSHYSTLPAPKDIATVKKSQPLLSYVTHGSRKENKIALTFDADMTPGMSEELRSGKVSSWYNQSVVDTLEKEKVPATIFMAGMWGELYPEITKQLANNPLFEIANHSYSHPRFTEKCFALPKMPSWGREGEFQKSQDTIAKITGITPTFFRFPGGCQSDSDIKIANKYGLTVVGWDVASGDSFNDNAPAILNTVKTRTQNGSIILFHFHGNKNAPKTAQVLPEIITYLRQKGFVFVKLSDLTLEL